MTIFLSLLFLSLQTIPVIVVYEQTTNFKLTWSDKLIIILAMIVGGITLNRLFFIALLCALLYVGFKHQRDKNFQIILFFSLYSSCIYSMIGNLFFYFFSTHFPDYHTLINLLAIFTPILINMLIMRVIRPDVYFLFDYHNKKGRKLLTSVNIILFIQFISQFMSYIWEDQVGDLGNFRYFLTGSFLLTIFILVFYLKITIQKLQKKQLDEFKDEQMQQMMAYSLQVENLYNDIRSVRHDFINILTSIERGIKEQDIEQVQSAYDTVVKEFKSSLQNSKYELVNLSNLKISPLKSLLSAKIINAQQLGIEIKIEIMEEITFSHMELLDLIRILSIFLDNAIEASILTDLPKLYLAIILSDETEEQLFIIKNSCEEKNMDLKKIFQVDVSSKGKNRGVGLATVKDIMIKYPQARLETELKNKIFSQTLILKRM